MLNYRELIRISIGGFIGAALIGTALAQTVSERFKDAFSAIQRNDYATATEIFRGLADEGNSAAQYNLGNIYLQKKNYAEAAKWMQRAAEQGDPLSQSVLSGLYLNGWGVPEDLVQAYKWAALAHLRRKPIMGGTEQDIARVASKMSAEQIKQAQRLVHHWKPNPTKNNMIDSVDAPPALGAR